MTGLLLRWQLFAAYGAAFAAIWGFALKSMAEEEQKNLLVEYAPVWAILALGIYAGVSVLYGVANFRDCPEAAKEIEQQVAEARKELKRRGIIS